MPSTNLGRVLPIYKGSWSLSSAYEKLDNVLHNGNTYIAIKDVPAFTTETEPDTGTVASEYWQLIASKGDTGGVGAVSANATKSDTAWASARVYGENPGAMNFAFEFGLPKGDIGDPAAIKSASAIITPIPASSTPSVLVNIIDDDPANASLAFDFHLPSVSGAVSTVNNKTGDVTLTATDVGAAAAPTNVTTIPNNSVIKYSSSGFPSYSVIKEVPAVGVGTANKVLRVQYNGENYLWGDVKEVPETSSQVDGYVLTATSSSYEWQGAMSTTDIDNIINAE